MTHIGITNVKKVGASDNCPKLSVTARSSKVAMPLIRLPETPHLLTKRFANRAATIIAIATVAKLRLNWIFE